MAYSKSVGFGNVQSQDAQDYAIQQAQALAQMLRQQSMQPIESAAPNAPISWTQGLAKMLQSYQAADQGRQVKQLLNQRDQQAQSAITDKLNALLPQQGTEVGGVDASSPGFELSTPLVQPNAIPGAPNQPQLSGNAKLLSTALANGNPEQTNSWLGQQIASRLLPPPQQPFELAKGAKRFDAQGKMIAENPDTVALEHVSRPLANDMVQEGTFNKDTGEYSWGTPHKGHEPATIAMLNNPGSQDSIKSDAELVASGRAPLPPFGGMGASGVRNGEVRRQALALNPRLDGTLYQQRNAAEKSFAASLDGRNLDSYNTIAQHVAFGEQAYRALKNGDIQGLNSMANSLGIQVGQAPAFTYRNIATFLGNETARATIGGQSGEEDRNKLSTFFTDAASPDQAASAYNAAKTLIGGRIMSSRRRYQSATHIYDTAQHKMVEDSDAFDAKLTPAALEFEQIGSHAGTPAASASGPKVVRYEDLP